MKTLWFVMGFTIILASCSTTQPAENTADTTVSNTPSATSIDSAAAPVEALALSGNWALYSMSNSTARWEKIPVLSIDVKSGGFNVATQCKSMNGRFAVQRTSCVFDNQVITSKMGCTANDDEDRFLQTLLRINSFSVNDTALQLKEVNAVQFIFKKQPI